jgi:acetoin:2,6-dichlorophenolindophenol oxidoreductase subunit alpha
MTTSTVTDAPLFRMYRTAVTIRKCDDRFTSMLTSGEIAMTYYSPMGQEVISAAMSAAAGDDDYVVTTYRGLHDHIAAGVPLDLLWAEFLGKATGTCKGKGGPMHITHPESGLMVTTGIVGAGLPIANGLALSSSMRGDGRVTVVNFGDGSTNIGAFHEALNLASLWDLPVVFVCQNNQYGEKTAFAHHTKVACIADRASSYAMRGVTVNGNDASEMWAAAREAVDRARSGAGPTLLEAKTFRFRGHTFGDDQAYIPVDQMAAARDLDPVPLLRAKVVDSGAATEDEVAALEAEVDAELEKAVQFALGSPPPNPAEINRDVYAQEGTR